MRRSPAPFREAFDSAPDALLLVDADGRVVRLNRAAERLPVANAPGGGEPFVFLWPRAVRPAMSRWLERLGEEGSAAPTEVALPTPCGEIVLELTGWLLGGPPPLREVLVRDITERVRLAERAVHAERLASIGRLAAMLAHEIRNTLAGVDGALQIFQLADELPASRREIVVEMRERISRTREVVDDLLAYARPPRLDRHPWPAGDVLDALRDSIAGMAEVEGVAITIENGCTADDRVAVDAFHLRRVARNLIVNAAQAMAGRGRVALSCERAGGEVRFRFRDDGPGVPETARDRVFEPFFTTRPGGTGLGLPIAANVVEAHGGRLYLEPCPNGCCFVVALPVAPPDAT